MKQLYLIGYMGSGKSTIGSILATKLDWSYIDLDHLIETRIGLTIPEIFQRYDEEKFRTLESSALHSLSDNDKVVISVGGGAPCHNNNVKVMCENGMVIYLKVPVEVLEQRILNDSVNIRPIINQWGKENLLDNIRQHLRKREHYYNRAHHIIDASRREDQVVAEILTII